MANVQRPFTTSRLKIINDWNQYLTQRSDLQPHDMRPCTILAIAIYNDKYVFDTNDLKNDFVLLSGHFVLSPFVPCLACMA